VILYIELYWIVSKYVVFIEEFNNGKQWKVDKLK
jgi:hypothetical protein